MGSKKQRAEGELVQGTLDMLILKALAREAMHGYGIAQQIQQLSGRSFAGGRGLALSGIAPA